MLRQSYINISPKEVMFMKKIHSFLIFGGDERFKFTEKRLTESGCKVLSFSEKNSNAIDFIKNSQSVKNIILPNPYSKDGMLINMPNADNKITISDFIENIEPNCNVFLGGLNNELLNILSAKDIKAFDYTKYYDFTEKNAALTAKGIEAILKKNLTIPLSDAEILITGFGYTAKATVKLLNEHKTDLTVAARRTQALNCALRQGCKAITIDSLKNNKLDYDVIINTVPALIFDKSTIENIDKDCLLLEIASPPYGIDFELADKYGIKVLKAPNLPGRTAPEAAGYIVADTVYKISESEEEK